jgi:hypothetical protein
MSSTVAGRTRFNLVFSLLVLRGALSNLETLGHEPSLSAFMVSHGWMVELFLGWLPLTFSGLFFLIPLGRLLKVQALQRRRQLQNIHKRLYKVIFARRGEPQTMREIVDAVNTHASEESLSSQVVEARMQECTLDLAGEMTVTETAEVQVSFPRIARELHEIQQLRRHRRLDDTLGDIIAEVE